MYERILVGTDGSAAANRAVEAAARLAAAHDAELVVALAFRPRRLEIANRQFRDSVDPRHAWRFTAGAVAETMLQSAVATARAAGGPRLDMRSRSALGASCRVVAQLADELGPDVIVIAGEPTRRLLRRVGCDVIAVDQGQSRRIVKRVDSPEWAVLPASSVTTTR